VSLRPRAAQLRHNLDTMKRTGRWLSKSVYLLCSVGEKVAREVFNRLAVSGIV
jgi:hypothetical protein